MKILTFFLLLILMILPIFLTVYILYIFIKKIKSKSIRYIFIFISVISILYYPSGIEKLDDYLYKSINNINYNPKIFNQAIFNSENKIDSYYFSNIYFNGNEKDIKTFFIKNLELDSIICSNFIEFNYKLNNQNKIIKYDLKKETYQILEKSSALYSEKKFNIKQNIFYSINKTQYYNTQTNEILGEKFTLISSDLLYILNRIKKFIEIPDFSINTMGGNSYDNTISHFKSMLDNNESKNVFDLIFINNNTINRYSLLNLKKTNEFQSKIKEICEINSDNYKEYILPNTNIQHSNYIHIFNINNLLKDSENESIYIDLYINKVDLKFYFVEKEHIFYKSIGDLYTIRINDNKKELLSKFHIFQKYIDTYHNYLTDYGCYKKDNQTYYYKNKINIDFELFKILLKLLKGSINVEKLFINNNMFMDVSNYLKYPFVRYLYPELSEDHFYKLIEVFDIDLNNIENSSYTINKIKKKLFQFNLTEEQIEQLSIEIYNDNVNLKKQELDSKNHFNLKYHLKHKYLFKILNLTYTKNLEVLDLFQ